jgi:hypothetical protein
MDITYRFIEYRIKLPKTPDFCVLEIKEFENAILMNQLDKAGFQVTRYILENFDVLEIKSNDLIFTKVVMFEDDLEQKLIELATHACEEIGKLALRIA